MVQPFGIRTGGSLQEDLVVKEVFVENSYRLPEKFGDKDVVIDVGAHIGSFSVACLNRGAALVYSCEPHPENVRLLRENLKSYKKRSIVVPMAVWKSGTKEQIRLRDCRPWTAQHHITPLGNGRSVDQIGLDDILKMHPRVRLLKLDCEGSEFPILYSSRLLNRVEEIVGEYHLEMKVDGLGSRTEADVRTLLESNGFFAELSPSNTHPELVGMFYGKRTKPDAGND